MKNIFKYINIIFFITINCINAGEGNSMHKYNNNTLLIPYNNNNYKNIYDGMPFIINHNFNIYNRKERRALGQRKHNLTAEDKAQRISDKIDNELLRIDKNCCGNYIIGKLNILFKLADVQMAGKDAFIKELNAIDIYVKQSDSHVLDILMQKNTFFSCLIRNLVEIAKLTVDDEFLKGSTIDTFYYEDRMFSSLSPLLSSYIGNKVKQAYQVLHQNNYKIDSVLASNDIYFNSASLKKIQKCNFNEMNCYYKYYEEIHMTRLEHNSPIKINSIMISDDKKYIKVDTFSHQTIWNMMTGEKCNNCQKKNWQKKDFINKDNRLDESYYIELCEDRFLGFALCTKKGLSTINIYMKPTFLSRLCQIAFMNSVYNNEELDALLHSDAAKSLTGFAKNNLERAIINAKLQNSKIIS